MPGLATQQDDVVEGQMPRERPLAALETGFEQRASIGRAASIEHRLDAGLDIARQNIGQETEPPPIDTQQRPDYEPGGWSNVPSPPTATM